MPLLNLDQATQLLHILPNKVKSVCGGAHCVGDQSYGLPSLMRFLRPRVPILSQKLSSLSGTLLGVRGDFGRVSVAILS